jgi:hypothetical protein
MSASLKTIVSRYVCRHRESMRVLAVIIIALSVMNGPATAQSSQYDQRALGELLDAQGSGALPDRPIPYRAYVIEHETGNSVRARHQLYLTIGDGDAELGRRRLGVTLLLNGAALRDLQMGDTLVLPARPEDFELDPRAYAPFPAYYDGADEIPKLVVVDKDVQAWAAYAHGELQRWGPASTGSAGTPTPTGRFNMNWRELDRISSESPPGQQWRMRYVMNIHNARGIHLHQYDSVPSGPPVGHGCVRMIMADARWLWEWSEPWVTSAGRGALGGQLVRRGTPVIVQGDEPKGRPKRYMISDSGADRVIVDLPVDPMKVPRGDR